jgi:chromosome segregation ATPase
MQIDYKSSLFFLVSFAVLPLSGAVPRATLAHFEKDLHKMAKSSQLPFLKKGSFVDRLAGKRLQKEQIDKSLASLQDDVDQLQVEVAKLESICNELDKATQEATEKIEKQNIFAQRVTIQLEREKAALQTLTT